MAYIGSTPASQGFIPGIDYFSGNGSTLAFTLSRNVTSVYQVEVVIDNVIQNPSSAFTVLNNTITFTSAPLTGTNNIWVEYVTFNSSLVQPGAGTVNTVQLGDINSISSATSLSLKTNVGVERMRIDSAGNVGIGTSSPTPTNASNISPKLVVTGAGAVHGIQSIRAVNPGGGGAQIIASTTRGTDTNSYTALQLNDGIGTLSFNGADGTRFIPSATIVAQVDGAVSTDNVLGRLAFCTSAGGANSVLERMRIDSAGNVGIGTSSPGAILHTFKTSAAAATVGAFIQNNDNTVGTEVRLGFAANANLLSQDRYGWIGYVNTGGVNGGALTFATTPGGTPATERMRIDSSGNVGIGTSSPSSRLTVVNTTDNSVPLAVSGSTSLIKDYGPSINFQYSSGAGQILANIKGAWDATGSGGLGNLIFSTRRSEVVTEAMRIDSSGNLLVGTTAVVSPGGVSGVGNIVNTANNGLWALALQNNGTSASTGRGLGIRNVTDFNTTSSEFIYCVGNATPRFFVQSNGGVYNYSANNTNLSDVRVKKDIEPAPSWLNKIDAIEVVNFKYKDQTHDDFNLGVIAQQVESVAPELINIDGFGETPEDGIPLKSIYETDLMYAMLKSIQELKAIIDTQQTTIVELQSDIKELKGVK